MNRTFILLVLGGFLLTGIFGCEQASTSDKETLASSSEGYFPEFLAGKWKGDKLGWGVAFDSEGKISSVLHGIGSAEVFPDRITRIPVGNGGTTWYDPGPWEARYNPVNRELVVEIELKKFHLEIDTSIAEGHSKDILVGKVNKDCKTWQAEWYAFPEYIFNTDEFTNYKLPVDFNDNPIATIIFTKLEESK